MTISVLVALLVLGGVGLMLWAVEARIGFGPTPTPTATPRPIPSPTPDVRATLVAEDMATQIALLVALQTRAAETSPPLASTPIPPGVQPESPIGAPGLEEPDAHDSDADGPPAAETDTEQSISLPSVGDGSTVGEDVDEPALDDSGLTESDVNGAEAEVTRTPITVGLPAVAGGELPTPTPTQVMLVEETPTPVEIPTEIPTEIPPEIPTETPTLEPPTPTPEPPPEAPTPTATSTPPLFTVASLRGEIQNADTTARVAPSNVYTDAGTFAANTTVTLLGRNRSGEWVFACCTTGGLQAWVRQAHALPAGNTLGDGAPEGADPNDVRWLGIQALPSNVTPAPTPTPIPVGDYPLFRYNAANQGRLGNAPNPPVSLSWPGTAAQAGGAFTSPAIVAGNSVLAASLDNHLYNFDRNNGSQRWRHTLGSPLRVAPAVQGNMVYVALENSLVLALDFQGSQAAEFWRATLPGSPVTSFIVYENLLFIGVGQPNSYQLVTLNRNNGAILRTLPITGQRLTQPALGEQLLYVGGNALIALDVTAANTGAYEIVWGRDNIVDIAAPPLYAENGVRAVAELYVVDGANRIHNLDANTGRERWNVDNGEPATGLAFNQGALFVSGNGYVKSISRENGAQLWRATVQGGIMGGPIVDDEYVIIVTQVGIIQFLNAASGNTVGGSSITASAGGAPAVSPPYLFVPGSDGRLYALQGNP